MNTKTLKLVIAIGFTAVLTLLLATTAPLLANGNKTKPTPTPTPSESPGIFSSTGSMNVTRYGHKAILLGNGQVLAVTGVPVNTTLDKSAELYNPATGTWTLTGTPAMFHEGGSATRLANGQVLLAGGDDPFDFSPPALTTTAELYNPSTGQWSPTGSMPSALRYQAAVLLPSGEVLVAGGLDSSFSSIASAALYNPATGTWQPTASMHQARSLEGNAVAQLLGDGTVLVAGGFDYSKGSFISSLSSAEIYNPSTGKWTSVANMPSASGGLSSLLQNGDVLVLRDAFFDPGTGTWTATGQFPTLNGTLGAGPSTATVLTTGHVLLTGFRSSYNDTPSLNTTMLYNFSTNTYAVGARMNYNRFSDVATLLPNGQVLISGGYNRQVGYGIIPLSSAELYTP